MKRSELRELWDERLKAVEAPISRKEFFKEIDNLVKEVHGKVTNADLAVIAEIHKATTDVRMNMNEESNKNAVYEETKKLDVISEFLDKVGKSDVRSDLDMGKYDNYPYPRRNAKNKEINQETEAGVTSSNAEEIAKEEPVERKTAWDIVKESRKEIADKILESMKSGELMWRKDWQKLAPYNAKTGRNYHGINQIRLFVESVTRGLDDPRFMTFKQAEEKGYHIKKGAEGIMLENWQNTKEQPLKDELGNVILSSDGKPLTETVELERPMVTYFRVFNAKDIEGIEPLPKLDVEREPVKNELINNVLGSSRCEIKEEVQDRAYYRVDEDRIVLPPRENFTSLDAFLATALHEMSHSTGHESCLNRPLTGQFGSEEYAKEELRAELGSAFMQATLGINLSDIDIENHGAYMQSWISALENNYNEFFFAVSDADRIAGVLEKNYEQYCIEHGMEKDKDQEISYEVSKDGINASIDGKVLHLENTTDRKLEISAGDAMKVTLDASEDLYFYSKSIQLKPLVDAIKESPESISVIPIIDDVGKKKKQEKNLALAE